VRNSAQRQRFAVASPHHAATQVGADVLRAGGNALDAAVATNAMLGVVYPHMCGLGGDAFLLYYSAAEGRVYCLNGSGPAPRLATRAAYRRRGLTGVPARGPLAVTVPGAVGAWDTALRRFGSRSLGELLAPAAAAASSGIEITARVAAWLERTAPELIDDQAARRRFFSADGAPLRPGAHLPQPELATTLHRLIEHGSRDFYKGDLATRIGRAFREADGMLREDDLATYRPEWVEPVSLRYRGHDVVTTPPNSQGLTLLMMLNAMAELAAHAHMPGTAAYVDAFVHAKRAAFADRDRYLSDPTFVKPPTDELLTEAHAREALAGSPPAGQTTLSGDTVYLCTTDGEGNACSLIQSLYYAFGSCFTAGDTGILLHNRGHAFSLDDEHPNRLEPGKRTLHTLMACLAFENDRLRFVFGTMGADGQAQVNAQVLDRLLTGATPAQALAAPRVLHGRFTVEDDPTLLHVEQGIGQETIDELRRGGHDPQLLADLDEHLGHAHAIELRPDGATVAGSDPRSDGAAIVGP
jgi:gamma-glutamyltranspeptidase